MVHVFTLFTLKERVAHAERRIRASGDPVAVICGLRSGMAPESRGRGGPGCPSSGLALPPQDPTDERTALPTPWPLSDSAYKSLWPLAVVLALGSLLKVPGGEGPRVLGPGMFQVGPPVSSEATSIQGLGCRSRASGLSGLIFCGGGGGALSRWDAGRKTWCPSLWSLHRLGKSLWALDGSSKALHP